MLVAPLVTSEGIPPAARDQNHTLMNEFVRSIANLYTNHEQVSKPLMINPPSASVVVQRRAITSPVVHPHSTAGIVRRGRVAIISSRRSAGQTLLRPS